MFFKCMSGIITSLLNHDYNVLEISWVQLSTKIQLFASVTIYKIFCPVITSISTPSFRCSLSTVMSQIHFNIFCPNKKTAFIVLSFIQESMNKIDQFVIFLFVLEMYQTRHITLKVLKMLKYLMGKCHEKRLKIKGTNECAKIMSQNPVVFIHKKVTFKNNLHLHG